MQKRIWCTVRNASRDCSDAHRHLHVDPRGVCLPPSAVVCSLPAGLLREGAAVVDVSPPPFSKLLVALQSVRYCAVPPQCVGLPACSEHSLPLTKTSNGVLNLSRCWLSRHHSQSIHPTHSFLDPFPYASLTRHSHWIHQLFQIYLSFLLSSPRNSLHTHKREELTWWRRRPSS